MSPVIWTVDIETKPILGYTWGLWQQNISLPQIVDPGGIMMFAAKQYGEKDIEAHCEWDDADAMVSRLHEIYDAADYIVTYNGASFDNKYISRAFVERGITPPSPHRDLDLLKVVRKRFAFPSKKLSYVCGALGLDLKTDPGGFQTWVDILSPQTPEDTRAEAKDRMEQYCRNDVAITEQLFDRLKPWVDGLNVPLYSDANPFDAEPVPSCNRCGSTNLQRRGWAYTTTYRYRRYQCRACGGWLREKRSESTPSELRNA